jgi:hypothetical protein
MDNVYDRTEQKLKKMNLYVFTNKNLLANYLDFDIKNTSPQKI